MRSLLSKKSLLILILLFALILRIWRLNDVPVSLFGDEVDIGYQAYSILNTGKDYSGNFLPIYLRSLADYKSSLYAYSLIPSVAIFGISDLGVRIPAAIFGVLGIFVFYLLINLVFKNRALALLSAFILTISPWHMHYSRWGFEGTEMLALYLLGLYSFLKSFNNGRWLIGASIFFALTLFSYHSAKVFLPFSLIVLALIYYRQIRQLSKKYLLLSSIIFVLIITPFAVSTFFGGGTNRFQATSLFNDPTMEGNIGFDRLRDKEMENSFDKFFHNKITYFSSIIINNYLHAFSTEFLFIKGDPQPTHTPSGYGQFYKLEAIFLALGLCFLFLKVNDKKTKLMFAFWILAAPLPSIATDQGGYHASRLLFLLPPLILIVSLGIYYSYSPLKRFKYVFLICLTSIYLLSFVFYEHNYWVHYPWDSQRWWHAGFKQAIQSAVSEGEKYNKVIISGANEPPLIFFLGWSKFPPSRFIKEYPLSKESLGDIGEVSRLDKYYFPPIGKEISLYELGKVLPEDTLYLATAKEIKIDLIKEPDRVPSDLSLIKSIPYPSGEGAFYIFAKK